MKEKIGQGPDKLLIGLHKRFPDLNEAQLKNAAAYLIQRIAEALEKGETIGLAKIGDDGLPTELRILEISESGVEVKPSQVSRHLFSDFFVKTSK